VHCENPEEQLDCDVSRLEQRLPNVIELVRQLVAEGVERVVVEDKQDQEHHHPPLHHAEVLVVELIDLNIMVFSTEREMRHLPTERKAGMLQ
jgi:hypothetical protein